MKAAIIAAGLGERLHRAGFTQPKPLVPVAGRPLIDYALGAIAAVGIDDVACIVNDESQGIEDHCRSQWSDLQFEFIRRTTPSSMESFFTLAPLLSAERFLLLTVDAVFAPATLRNFLVATSCRATADGILAVNGFVDDEKPLWAELAPGGRILTLGPAAQGSGLVTAGFYVFEPSVFAEIAVARRRRFGALREFLGHLVSSGYTLYGKRVAKTVDVDRAEDIEVAEAFVRSGFTK